MDVHPICTLCLKNAATVKLMRISKGSVEETLLCQSCASSNGPFMTGPQPAAGLLTGVVNLEQLLAGIMGKQGAPGSEGAARVGSPADSELTCGACGLPFETYRATLILGCSECYTAFAAPLTSDLRKFHGAVRHKGRVPDGAPPPTARPRRTAGELRRRMVEAVRAEDFQTAARLRDDLSGLDSGA